MRSEILGLGSGISEAIEFGYHLNMVEPTPGGSDIIQGEAASDGIEIVSTPRVVRRSRWAAIVLMLMLGVYAVLLLLAHNYAYFGWDLTCTRSIQSISVPGFELLMTAVSFLGGWISWLLVVSIGLGLIKKGLKAEGFVCIGGTAVGAAINLLFKALVGRPRPTDLLVNVTRVFHHESFPSGHVVFYVEFFGFLFFLAYVLLERGVVRVASLIVLGLLIALVGVSRVYLGAHWPSDVCGAYLAGGIWLMLMIEVYRRLKTRLANVQV